MPHIIRGAPIVMVIFNSTRYSAVRDATMSMFASGAAGRENGLGLAQSSVEKIAEAHSAFAAGVERPAESLAVLTAARDAVLLEKGHAW